MEPTPPAQPSPAAKAETTRASTEVTEVEPAAQPETGSAGAAEPPAAKAATTVEEPPTRADEQEAAAADGGTAGDEARPNDAEVAGTEDAVLGSALDGRSGKAGVEADEDDTAAKPAESGAAGATGAEDRSEEKVATSDSSDSGKTGQVAKPAVGARAGAGSSKASRKKGRGRQAATPAVKATTAASGTEAATPSKAEAAAPVAAVDERASTASMPPDKPADADKPVADTLTGDKLAGNESAAVERAGNESVPDEPAEPAGDKPVAEASVTGKSASSESAAESTPATAATEESATSKPATNSSESSAPSSADAEVKRSDADNKGSAKTGGVESSGAKDGSSKVSGGEGSSTKDSPSKDSPSKDSRTGSTAGKDSASKGSDSGAVKSGASGGSAGAAGGGAGAAAKDDATVVAEPFMAPRRARRLAAAQAEDAPARTRVIGATGSKAGGSSGPVTPVSGAPGLGSANRPAWQPMDFRAPSGGRRGLTILGVTLTRRQTVVGFALLAAVLLLLGLLIPLAFAGDGDGRAADRGTKAGVAPTASAAQPQQSTAAAPPPKQQQSSAAPSAPASSAPSGAALPKGWHMYGNPRTGFSVPVPDGALIDASNSDEIQFRWGNRLLLLAQTDQPAADPMADWKDQEATRSGGKYRDYERIRMVPVDYFQKAVDWEFLYTTSSGNRQHAVKRNFLTGPKQAYSINWYTSPEDWDAAKKDLQVIYDGFKPLS